MNDLFWQQTSRPTLPQHIDNIIVVINVTEKIKNVKKRVLLLIK